MSDSSEVLIAWSDELGKVARWVWVASDLNGWGLWIVGVVVNLEFFRRIWPFF